MRPTFLIPFFYHQGSNATFAQELDADFRIVQFLTINLEHFIAVPDLPSSLIRRLGEEGIMAAADPSGRVTYGAASDLRTRLAAENVEAQASFFAVDALTFLGDRTRLRRAIRVASGQLSRASVRNRWAARTRLVSNLATHPERRTKMDPLAEQDQQFSSLSEVLRRLQDPHLPEWAKVWRSAYRQFDYQPRLRDVGLWWLGERSKWDDRSLRLAEDLLKHSGGNAQVKKLVLGWVLRNHYDNAFWPRLWRGLVHDYGLDDELKGLGIDYLNYLSSNQLISGASLRAWLAVWRLLVRNGLKHEISISLARHYYDAGQTHKHFIQGAVEVVYRWAERDATGWAQTALLDWLYLRVDDSSVWPAVYNRLFDDGESRDEFIALGLSWLNTGKPNLRAWKAVWERLLKRAPSPALWEAAEKWLVRSNVQMRIWPDILAAVLKDHQVNDADIGEKAAGWVLSGMSHPERRLIAEFAAQWQNHSSEQLVTLRGGIDGRTLKKFLDNYLGYDGRISAFTYEWVAGTVSRIGLKTIDEVMEAVAPYDDAELSQLLTGTRQGQTTRFEYMLLAAFGERYIRAHPYRNYASFRNQQQHFLRQLDAARIPRREWAASDQIPLAIKPV